LSIDLIIKNFHENRNFGEIDSKEILNFSADGSKTVWKIRIKSWGEHYGCYLLLDDVSSNDDRPVETAFKFSLIDSQGKEVNVKSDTFYFEKRNQSGFDQFISKDYLNVLGDQVICNNSLSIRCEFKLINSNGDLETFHSNYEKLQKESLKRIKKFESLELDYDKNKKELLLKKVELKSAESIIEQLRSRELDPLKSILEETERKLSEAEKSWDEERLDLNTKIQFLTKEFEERSRELDEYHEKFHNLFKDQESLKVELELVRAMTESIDMNCTEPQVSSSVEVEGLEDLNQDWEKLDYDYY
jgi:hypothetical protein